MEGADKGDFGAIAYLCSRNLILNKLLNILYFYV